MPPNAESWLRHWWTAAILKNRYDVVTPPTIVWLRWNMVGRYKMICRWAIN